MKQLAIPLAGAALAVLGACTTIERPAPGPFATATVVSQPVAYRAGHGTVERVVASPSHAAAGGSATAQRMNRVYVRMQDGTVQYIDTTGTELRSGMRIELLPDRTIRIQQ